MNQIITLLVCAAFVANVNTFSFGSWGNMLYNSANPDQKGKISKELLESLGQVCSRCSIYQSACMKLKELKQEIIKLPSKPSEAEPRKPAGMPDKEGSKNKVDGKAGKVTMTDFLDELKN